MPNFLNTKVRLEELQRLTHDLSSRVSDCWAQEEVAPGTLSPSPIDIEFSVEPPLRGRLMALMFQLFKLC